MFKKLKTQSDKILTSFIGCNLLNRAQFNSEHLAVFIHFLVIFFRDITIYLFSPFNDSHGILHVIKVLNHTTG